MWLSNWVLMATMVFQAGAGPVSAPPVMPKLIAMQQPLFAIPFRVERSNDPAWQPVEAQLYVSTDRGVHWRMYAKAPVTQTHFMFRAGVDGEYWFAVRTADRSGRVRPETIATPGLRVRVDAKLSAPKRKTTTVSTPVGGKHASPGKRSDAAATIPGLPSGERPRMVNSRLFELEYDVDSVGPSGIGRVELWGTSDGGRTWRSFASDNDNRSPLRVKVDGESVYGFRMVVANGAGLGGRPPKSGDLPDLWIGVDLTKPAARIVSAKQGVDSESGRLIISWQADDKMLAVRPVSLSFSQDRAGPWTPIAAGLENTGRYAWPIDDRTPPQFYLRLEVRDEAGNVGVHEMTEPVVIDQSRPTARIRDVRPVGQTGVR